MMPKQKRRFAEDGPSFALLLFRTLGKAEDIDLSTYQEILPTLSDQQLRLLADRLTTLGDLTQAEIDGR